MASTSGIEVAPANVIPEEISPLRSMSAKSNENKGEMILHGQCPKLTLGNTTEIGGEDKMNMTLAILYAPEGHKPLSIARINDRSLLSAAAERAISEAEAAAIELMETDPTLGALQFEEANKLRRVLSLLVTPTQSFAVSVM